MASEILIQRVSAVMMMIIIMGTTAALLSCRITSARTISTMENMKSGDMEKTFFHPFLPPYLLGHGGPFFGGGIVRGGGLGAGLGGGLGSAGPGSLGLGGGGGVGGGFGGGLGVGVGNGDDQELGSRIINGGHELVGSNGGGDHQNTNKNSAAAAGDLGRAAGADQGLP